jgi:hypothetical protein
MGLGTNPWPRSHGPAWAAQSLQASFQPRSVPIHWGTYYPLGFNLFQAGFCQIPYVFKRLLQVRPAVRIQIIQPGNHSRFIGLMPLVASMPVVKRFRPIHSGSSLAITFRHFDDRSDEKTLLRSAFHAFSQVAN